MSNERVQEAVIDVLEEYVPKYATAHLAARIVQAVLQHAASGAAFQVTPEEWTAACELAGYVTARPAMGYAHVNAILAQRPSAPAPSGAVEVPSMPDLVTLERSWLQYRDQGPKGVAVWAAEQIGPHARAAVYWMDNAKRFEAELSRLKSGAQRPAPSAPRAQAWTREAARHVWQLLPVNATPEQVYEAWAAVFGSIAPVASAPPTVKELVEATSAAVQNRDVMIEDLKRELAAERAAHEATKKALASSDEAVTTLNREVDWARNAWNDATSSSGKASGRAQEAEGKLQTILNLSQDFIGFDDAVKAVVAMRDRLASATREREAAEKRAAELERELAKVREELAEAQGECSNHYTAWKGANGRAQDAEAELAACRAKLEGLREACALSEAEACYLSTYGSWDQDSPVAVIKRIQAALQATQAEKPAKLPEPASTEKPSLEERVGRVERALLTFCRADSLEARAALSRAMEFDGLEWRRDAT